MVRFTSRAQAITFYIALTAAILLTINGAYHGFFSLYDTLINPLGYVPYSDNFEKGVFDPEYLFGDDGGLGRKGAVGFSDDLNFRSLKGIGDPPEPGSSFSGLPLYDLDGEPYPIFVQGGGGVNQFGDLLFSRVRFVKDLRGKKAEFRYRFNTRASGGGMPIGTVCSNCGCDAFGKMDGGAGRSGSGIIRIVSSNLDSSQYVFMHNGDPICSGILQPDENLAAEITINGDPASSINVHHLKWLFPYQCTPEEGLDLAFQDFESGETVTLVGSTVRWPKALCPELSPILLNQSAGGISDLRELLPLLATPLKGSKPYVVPNTCNDDNTGGCVLRLIYWIPKDPTIPNACVNPTLQKAFNLDTEQCDDIINIRNFCTEGIVYGAHCDTPTDIRAKFNCTATPDLNGEKPECYDLKTQTGVSAYCKPSDGIDPLPNSQTGTSLCYGLKGSYQPYTTFEQACTADGGKPEGSKCLREIPITFETKTGETLGTGTYTPNNQVTNVVSTAAGTQTITKKCESLNSKGQCVTTTSESELIPIYEHYLRMAFLGIKLKTLLLAISLLTIVWIGFVKKAFSR